jgi:hypothetical protein
LRGRKAVAKAGGSSGAAGSGSAFATTISSNTYAVLSKTDFENNNAPHVAYVYVVLVSMRARAWLDEAERVVVRGERWSRMLDRPVSLGYCIFLANMLPVARAAVDTGHEDKMLEGTYVGQELKAALTGDRFQRVRQAGTLGGNSNIAEVILALGRGDNKVLCMPLGHARMVYRVLCYLPPVQRIVDAAEAFFIFLFSHIPTVVLCNDSPGGLNGERYLDVCGDNAATVEEDVRKLGLPAGGVSRLKKMRVADVPQSWLRRALNGVHQLLKAGQLKALGAVVGPDMSDGSYSVQLCCQALTGGDEHTLVRTAPWCMACTCSWIGYWCPHLVMDALLRAAARNPVVADGPTPAMFLLPRGDSGPLQLARAPAARAPAARTPAPAGDMDAQLLEVVASTAATLAVLGEAGQRGRAAPAAWGELLSLVRRTFQAAQALVRDPEEGGGGRTRRSDRTKSKDDADRARGSEKRLRAPSASAHGVLARLLRARALN